MCPCVYVCAYRSYTHRHTPTHLCRPSNGTNEKCMNIEFWLWPCTPGHLIGFGNEWVEMSIDCKFPKKKYFEIQTDQKKQKIRNERKGLGHPLIYSEIPQKTMFDSICRLFSDSKKMENAFAEKFIVHQIFNNEFEINEKL